MESDPRYIVDLIRDVVADMRDTSSILSFTDNTDGTYTLLVLSTKDLADKHFITISSTTNFNGIYQISNLITDVSFDITKTAGIVTETGTWTADAPYYDYGHRVNVVERLQKKTSVYSKFPLIILDLDFEEEKGEAEIYSEATVSVFVCVDTSLNYSDVERYTNSFKAKLRPLADDFINKIMASNDFDFEDYDKVIHTRTDRPLWGVGGTGRNTAHKLTTPTDAIEMQVDLKVREKYDNCILT